MYKHLLSLIALTFLLVACSEDPSDPAGPGNTVLRMPKSGSTFTYGYVQTDTSTGMPIESSRRQSVTTIVASGITYNGRNNCMRMSTVDIGTATDAYFNYPASGDVEILQGASTPSGITYTWTTIPVKSKGATTALLYDTLIVVGTFSYFSSTTMTNEYVGTETITLPAGTMEVVRIKQTTTVYLKAGTLESEQELVGYMYFSLTLGVPVKYDYALMRQSSSGASTTGAIMELVSYDLK